ncbi:MAG: hypothetical protein ABR920_00740 [Terriglobales bacterium]|jgi:hypothetical protein
MKKFLILLVLVSLLSFPLMAQDYPKAEVFGGYQYMHFNDVGGCGYSNGFGCPSINFNGWDASVTGYFSKYLGVTGDFSGNYGSFKETFTVSGTSVTVNFPTHVYSFTGGPVVAYREGKVNPFAHALFGGAHANVSGSYAGVSASASKNVFTMMFGGGVDVQASKSVAVRLIDVDWVYYHYGSGSGTILTVPYSYKSGSGSKNVRISTGIVFRF